MNGIWFIRILDGVKHSWPDRRLEWVMGIWAIVWSVKWILDPVDNFATTSGAWEGLRYMFGADWFFASGMCLCGVLRVIALTVNGTFKNTIYARYSPVVRAITAALCGIAWLAIWLSVGATNSQGVVTFWAPVIIEFYLAFLIVDEGADVLREWHNGRSNRDDS